MFRLSSRKFDGRSGARWPPPMRRSAIRSPRSRSTVNIWCTSQRGRITSPFTRRPREIKPSSRRSRHTERPRARCDSRSESRFRTTSSDESSNSGSISEWAAGNDHHRIHLVPILLGNGVRFFASPGTAPINLEKLSVADRAALVVSILAGGHEEGRRSADPRLSASAIVGDLRLATCVVRTFSYRTWPPPSRSTTRSQTGSNRLTKRIDTICRLRQRRRMTEVHR